MSFRTSIGLTSSRAVAVVARIGLTRAGTIAIVARIGAVAIVARIGLVGIGLTIIGSIPVVPSVVSILALSIGIASTSIASSLTSSLTLLWVLPRFC